MKRRARTGAPAKIYPSAVVVPGATLGEDAVVGAFTFVAKGAIVGRGTRIQGHSSVWDGVTLGEDVFVGPGAMFTNVRHPRAAFPRIAEAGRARWDETVVADGATIGAHATLVAPLRVGNHAMIGAGAVVTGDVAAHALVMGVPARVRGWVCTCGEPLNRARAVPKRAACGRCGRTFVREANGLAECAATGREPRPGRGGPR